MKEIDGSGSIEYISAWKCAQMLPLNPNSALGPIEGFETASIMLKEHYADNSHPNADFLSSNIENIKPRFTHTVSKNWKNSL